ncbi:MAG: SNF2-related protein [Gemmatimonadales bacterium]
MPDSRRFQSLIHAFSPSVRTRGERYHREGRVTAIARVGGELQATVVGTEPWFPRISTTERGGLHSSCTCPYWEEHGECKHLYAALIEADRAGLLEGIGSVVTPPPPPATAEPPPRPTWAAQLKTLTAQMPPPAPPPLHRAVSRPPERQLLYLVIPPAATVPWLTLRIAIRNRKNSGEWAPVRHCGLGDPEWEEVAGADDREIGHLLVGATFGSVPAQLGGTTHFTVAPAALPRTLARCCATGRCFAAGASANRLGPGPLFWDSGPPWHLAVAAALEPTTGWYRVEGELIRDGERIPVRQTSAIVDGVFVAGTRAARWDGGPSVLAAALAAGTDLSAPREEVADLVGTLLGLPGGIDLTWPDDLGIDSVREPPKVWLTLKPAAPRAWARPELQASLEFEYGGQRVRADPESAGAPVRIGTRLYARDLAAETAAIARLLEAGARWEFDYRHSRRQLTVDSSVLPVMLPPLLVDGWHVEVAGQTYHPPGQRQAEVRTGIDWFELAGHVDYGDQRVALPELLAAARRGDRFITLGDGSRGLLPADWLAQLGPLVDAGSAGGDGVRFSVRQVSLLDALLATMPEVDVDRQLERARQQLASFGGIKPLAAPRTFRGTLRGYQKEGLGWLEFLRRFGFGGCLADDMGLGKTIEVLAFLERRRLAGAPASLAVVPRSLVFNWQREAAQFTPKLRVLDHSGVSRRKSLEHLADYDLILTTYGTLRRDAEQFRQITFDSVILDEAQAIKNPASVSAKAARLLQANHRFALTGTPIENHLGELWSLFEFLNPGMLGRAPAFQRLLSLDEGDGAVALARAVRPFILRRTKEQVAPELPERQEQTVLVTLDVAERKRYDELRDHYRATLLTRIDAQGIAASRIQILEALLRLRQAACHPGLLDPTRSGEASSKVELLLEQLEDVTGSGHKALVFSQFTTLLGIVRHFLDAKGVRYEYLDGSTRDRQARVDRFQTDPDCPLFLISLKAGGVGLNLTAADYVFLLDPWWNPAVEAQAIDRTHRIGQTRRVLATRLIARDTVEERVVELQGRKRALADAILREQDGAVGKIGREELAELLR